MSFLSLSLLVLQWLLFLADKRKKSPTYYLLWSSFEGVVFIVGATGTVASSTVPFRIDCPGSSKTHFDHSGGPGAQVVGYEGNGVHAGWWSYIGAPSAAKCLRASAYSSHSLASPSLRKSPANVGEALLGWECSEPCRGCTQDKIRMRFRLRPEARLVCGYRTCSKWNPWGPNLWTKYDDLYLILNMFLFPLFNTRWDGTSMEWICFLSCQCMLYCTLSVLHPLYQVHQLASNSTSNERVKIFA